MHQQQNNLPDCVVFIPLKNATNLEELYVLKALSVHVPSTAYAVTPPPEPLLPPPGLTAARLPSHRHVHSHQLHLLHPLLQ